MTTKKEFDKIPTTVNEFLSMYRLNPQDKLTTKITHTAITNPGVKSGGSFHIPADKMEDFLKAYMNDVFVNKQIFHLTEAHHQEVSPILIDLDFRQKLSDNPEVKKIYSDEDIKTYLSEYHKVLSQYIDEGELNKSEIAYVMEKKSAVKGKNDEIKDGVHIVYPHLCPSYRIQFLARHDMVNNPVIKELFKKMNVTNDIHNIIDLSVIRANNWFMYGSTKPNCEPYIITNIYKVDDTGCEISKTDTRNPSMKLMKHLSISNKKNITPMKLGIEDSVKEKYEGMPDGDKDNTDKSGANCKKLSKAAVVAKNHKPDSSKHNRNMIDTRDFEFAEKLTKECLSVKRATNYEDWIRVCWCLVNIDYRLENAFIELSKKCPGKFNEDGCRAEWDRAQTRVMERLLGLGTLHKWAKEDNMAKYKEITRDSLGRYMYISMNRSHTDITRYIFEKYKHEFKCSSISHNRWYWYKKHRWNINDRGNALKLRISSDVSQDYSEYATYCSNKANEYREDEPEKENWQNRSKTAADLVLRLRNTSFINAVFSQCQEFFFDESFEEELDSNDNLLHFLNGVYDLDKNEFREGYPEDNISLSTNINYLEQLDADDYGRMEQIEDFLNKIFPIENVRNYVMNLLASFLHGANRDQKFHIWTGRGGNGKSMLVDLYKKTLGSYCGSMPATILTSVRAGAENASPVLAATRGKRFISLDEAEVGADIQVGFMRQLTGGDEITARKLNCAPITFRPRFKLVLTCNELPGIPSNEDATWRRIRVVEFISRFCDNPDPKNPYEFHADKSLQSKMEEWREVFMNMLIGFFQNNYKINGIPEPAEVLRNTASYRSDSDIYKQFVDEFMRVDPNTSLGLDDIYPVFRDFLIKNNFDQKKHNRRELDRRLYRILGKANARKKWKGWKIVTSEDDEEEEGEEE
jgi:P4 family phage/plasmid primase-like protien